jgi:TetR/AcrR family transcriptional repressor of nem operon
MKVSREQAAENRERVLQTAARLFREKGVDGVGVAELMQAAGLTHGAFYGQFSSKEELVAEACRWALGKTESYWERLQAREADPLAAIVDAYLSPAHRDDPGRGCALTTLGVEAPRRDPGVRRAVSDGLVHLLARRLQAARRRRRALALMASLVGGLVLARAVEDEALSAEILAAVRAELADRQDAAAGE